MMAEHKNEETLKEVKHIFCVLSVVSISVQIHAFILGYSGAVLALVVFWIVKFTRAMYSIKARRYFAIMI